MINQNTIFIVNDIDKFLNELDLENKFIIKNDKTQDFLIEHSHKAIKEAYIKSDKTKYLILAGKFRIEAQNALLKLLEDTPSGVVIYLVTTSKSSILPTIISRCFVVNNQHNKKYRDFDINLKSLRLIDIYNFNKEYKNISKEEAKEFLYFLVNDFYNRNKNINKKLLDKITLSYQLLELNSKPIIVLNSILMELI